MAAPERAGAFSPSAAATVPGGPVLIGLAAAVMAGGRAALAYMADIAAVVLFAAALLALLRTFLGPLPAGAAFLVTGALGLCLRRLMAAYTPPCSWKWGRRACFCRFPLLRPGRGGSRGREARISDPAGLAFRPRRADPRPGAGVPRLRQPVRSGARGRGQRKLRLFRQRGGRGYRDYS